VTWQPARHQLYWRQLWRRALILTLTPCHSKIHDLANF
jgi:hypothetical protein